MDAKKIIAAHKKVGPRIETKGRVKLKGSQTSRSGTHQELVQPQRILRSIPTMRGLCR